MGASLLALAKSMYYLLMIRRIMQISEAVISEGENILLDLHNSSHRAKAEFDNCFNIYSKYY